MNDLLKYVGWLALAGTFLAPLLYYFDQFGEAGLRNILIVTMIVWFAVSFIRDRQQGAR